MNLLIRKAQIAGILACLLLTAACSSPEQKAEAHYASGKQLLEQQDYTRAALEFRNAVRLNDKSIDAWFGLVEVGEKTKDIPMVASSLLRITELDPTQVAALRKLASLQLMGGETDKALKNINAADALKKDDTDILATRAAILLRLGDAEGARKDAEKSLALNPDNPDALAVLAADALASSRPKDALLFIERGLNTDPGNLALLLFKLKIHETEKDLPKVEDTLRQLVAIQSESIELRRVLVGFLLSQKRDKEAEQELRAMASSAPDDSKLALEVVGFLIAKVGPDAGRKELEALISQKPDVIAFKIALAELDVSQGRTEEGLTAIKEVIAKGGPQEEVDRASLTLANLELNLGKSEEARKIVDDLLARDPKQSDALGLRAALKLQGGDTDGAIADLREALNQKPNFPAFNVLLAKAHAQQGAVELAIDRYVEAAKASNYDPATVLEAAAYMAQRGREEFAAKILTDATASQPRNRDFLVALAQLKLKQKDWEAVQGISDALKEIGDNSNIALSIEGLSQLNQGKIDEGLVSLKAAVQNPTAVSQSSRDLVLAYFGTGRLPEAEEFIQNLLKANPESPEALVLLGQLRTLQNKPEEAEKIFVNLIAANPENAAGYLGLASRYGAASRTDDQEKILKDGLAKVPGNVDLSLALGNLYEAKQDFEAAIAVYDEQYKKTPDSLVISNNLASLLSDRRTDSASLDRAAEVARHLEEIDSPFLKDTVGWVAYRRGDHRTALRLIEEASKQVPDNAVIRYHLGMIYLTLNRKEEAQREFAAARTAAANDPGLLKMIASAETSLNSTAP